MEREDWRAGIELCWLCWGWRGGGGGLGRGRPGGIWEALLRFIGVGILWTRGIIHGKASLSGSVYTMRQGWQRWRPSTSGPSCLNMGLGHLTRKHQTHPPPRPPQHRSNQPIGTVQRNVGQRLEIGRKEFPFLCHPSEEQTFEDFISVCWRSRFILTRLTTAPPRHLGALFTKDPAMFGLFSNFLKEKKTTFPSILCFPPIR